MKPQLSFIFILFLINTSSSAQSNVIVQDNYIQGEVVDSATLEPLPFVLIYMKENKQQVIVQTDIDGKFKLKIPANIIRNKMVFEISYVGYDNYQFTIKKKKLPVKRIRLRLKESEFKLLETY